MNFPAPIARVRAFVQDFFPENWLQLLFPFGSFVLMLGSWRSWLPPGHTLVNPQFQGSQNDLWFDFTSPAAKFGYFILRLGIGTAFFASIVLWSVRVEKPLREFTRWVIAPAVAAIVAFLSVVLLAKDPRISILEPKSQVVYEALHRFSARLLSLGSGFYWALIALAVTCVALWAFRSQRISLPVRFRSSRENKENRDYQTKAARGIFAIVIGTNLLVTIGSGVLAISLGNRQLPWVWETGQFPTFDWVSNTTYAAFAAACTFVILGKNRRQALKSLLRPAKIQDFGLALGVPVLVVLLARILQGMGDQYNWESLGFERGFPYSWSELLIPKPFPWLLLVFITALFQEVALRGYLQARLTELVGLKRAIFLVGLLWGILPLQYGIHGYLGLRIPFPGIETLINWAILVAYSIAIGWAFARTGSLLPAVVMHGTFLLFHSGSNQGIYLNQPVMYWLELCALFVACWYLFHRYPPAQRDEPPSDQQVDAN